jgi:hypothetical protein
MSYTADELRSLLVERVGNIAGKYGEQPAIWISPPLPPKGTEGVEIIIGREPIALKESNLSAGQRYVDRRWQLRLTDISSGDEFDVDKSISACISTIRSYFSVSNVVQNPPSDDTYEQARIDIRDPIVINGF